MKKTNRRSQYNKRRRHSETAQILLDSFHWDKDQQILLELASTGEFTVDEIREFRWNHFRQGFECLIVKDKELDLPAETVEFLEECLSQKKAIDGTPWEAPEDKLFSHKTGKDIYKDIISYKE